MSIRQRNAHFTDWAAVCRALNVATESEARTALESSDNPFYYYVCYIKSTKEIYTHGQFYNCSGNEDLLYLIQDLTEEVTENEEVTARALAELSENKASRGEVELLSDAIKASREEVELLSDTVSEINPNGITIVDSIDKLDPNAELGNLACVIEQGTIKESSFRDLYQPDASMVDQTAGAFTQPELLSSVSSINFLTPTDYSGVETAIILVPRTFSQTNSKMIQLGVAYSGGTLQGVIAVYINQSTGDPAEYIVGQVVDGVYTIDGAVVTAINDLLASDDWCYLGYEIFAGVPMTEEQFATLDKFAMAVTGVPSTANIYVKGDKWEQLYKNDLAKLATSLNVVSKRVDAKADPTMVQSLPYNKKLTPNTYYTATNSSTGALTYVLIAPTDTTKYSEYILQVKCTSTPSSVSFTNESGTALTIKWVNDTPPSFEAGFTYLISIANGFGVYSMFPNS